jgi:LacI family transcriptional regulator
MPVIDDLVKTSHFRAERGGYHAMREILNSEVRPDAVIMGYDQMAIGALKAIREAGLSVPGDIAIASFDDIIASEYVDSGITTIQCPCEDMVSIAFRVLMNRIEDRYTAPQQIALKPRLVVRGTA